MYFIMTSAQKKIQNSSKLRGRPKGSSYPASPLTISQIKDLYNSCYGKHGHYLRAFITFGLYSGMRVGTIARLTVNQAIDANGKVRDRIIVQADDEKSKSTHTYHLAPNGKRIIQEYVDYLIRDNPLKANDTPLFPSRKSGKCLGPSSASRMISNLLKKAGIEQNSSHALRKTFATTCYTDLGLGVIELSKLLNHSTVNQTQNYIMNLQPNITKALSGMKY